MQYLFRTYNGNKYIHPFGQEDTIEDAINYFENNFNFKDVKIYPIEDDGPKYHVEYSKHLNSFNTKRFLLCARYTRNSKRYSPEKDIKEQTFMKTPEPKKYNGQHRKESILLIQHASNLLLDNPDFDNIFNAILNIAKKSNIEHFNILKENKNKRKILELLKGPKDVSFKIETDDDLQIVNDGSL